MFTIILLITILYSIIKINKRSNESSYLCDITHSVRKFSKDELFSQARLSDKEIDLTGLEVEVEN